MPFDILVSLIRLVRIPKKPISANTPTNIVDQNSKTGFMLNMPLMLKKTITARIVKGKNDIRLNKTENFLTIEAFSIDRNLSIGIY